MALGARPPPRPPAARRTCGSAARAPTRRRDNEIRNNPQWIGDTAYFPERYGSIVIPAIIDL